MRDIRGISGEQETGIPRERLITLVQDWIDAGTFCDGAPVPEQILDATRSLFADGGYRRADGSAFTDTFLDELEALTAGNPESLLMRTLDFWYHLEFDIERDAK